MPSGCVEVPPGLPRARESAITSTMETTCRKCGTVLPEGAGRCPSCLELVKPPGFFQRLFGNKKFRVSFQVNTSREPSADFKPGVHRYKTVVQTVKFETLDPATGEKRVYHSLDEMPPEQRERFAKIQAELPEHPVPGAHITVRDADGTVHAYQSMDEVPPQLRKLLEDAKDDTGA